MTEVNRDAQTPGLDIPPGVEEAAKRYIQSRKQELPQLFDLAERRNFDQIRILAHKIKGTGTPYGFPELTRLARLIGTAAQQQDTGDLLQLLGAMSKYVEQAEALSAQQ